MSSDQIQENKKYRDLVNTARELFFKHGTKRVTIEEICEKADVSKMTFYKYFHNKYDLALTVLKEINDKWLREQDEIINKNIPFIEKIREVLNYKIRISEELEDIFLDELWGEIEDFSNFFTTMHEEAYQFFDRFIKLGQDEGVIRKNLKPEMIIYLSDILRDMLNSERMKSISQDPHERLDVILNFFFYGIIDTNIQKKGTGREE